MQVSSTLDNLVIFLMILLSRRCIVSVICWEMNARKDIFDTFIKGEPGCIRISSRGLVAILLML